MGMAVAVAFKVKRPQFYHFNRTNPNGFDIDAAKGRMVSPMTVVSFPWGKLIRELPGAAPAQ